MKREPSAPHASTLPTASTPPTSSKKSARKSKSPSPISSSRWSTNHKTYQQPYSASSCRQLAHRTIPHQKRIHLFYWVSSERTKGKLRFHSKFIKDLRIAWCWRVAPDLAKFFKYLKWYSDSSEDNKYSAYFEESLTKMLDAVRSRSLEQMAMILKEIP